MVIIRVGFLFLTFLLISCVTKPSESPYPPVYLTRRAWYTLLPPNEIEAPLDLGQHITGTYGEEEFVLEAWTEADENRVTMAFFNSLGVSMGDLSFDGGGLFFSSAFLPPQVTAEYILADFQLCFYRPEALEKALNRAGLTFKVEKAVDTAWEVRSLFEGKTLIIKIEKGSSSVVYTNYFRRYAYTLEGYTLEGEW
ncbi:MAG: DUF3261 domain-containing protein [Spirochaetaceae bacterium]|jgi:hypothetical protein|nr:DUF3261 domain-containing protein [Spirochaetaceae bacterium]